MWLFELVGVWIIGTMLSMFFCKYWSGWYGYDGYGYYEDLATMVFGFFDWEKRLCCWWPMLVFWYFFMEFVLEEEFSLVLLLW